MRATRGLWVWGFLLACFFWGTSVSGQVGTGELTGIVFDPSGATAGKANVQLTNTATAAVRNEVASDTGGYRFVALPVVGTYTLKVELRGFRTAEIGNIVITVGNVVTQDVHLELGAASETITVEARVQLLQTTQSQVSELVDNKVWQSMPLEARSQNTFINLLPAVVPNQFGGTTRGAAVAGGRPGMGNFMTDGYDNNDQGQGGRGAGGAGGAITSISPEAIQEYRVISHAFGAEYGKGGAFVTDTVLKSGTNNWHGSIFEYNRVQALAANSFFSNSQGIKDSLVRNQFGGSIGGPIFRDRTFFLASYEGHIRRQASPLTTTVTTQEFLDFVSSGAFETFQETNPNGFCVKKTGATCVGKFANSGKLGTIFSTLVKSQPFPLAPPLSLPCGTTVASAKAAQCLGLDGATSTSASRIIYPVHLFNTLTVIDPDRYHGNRGSLRFDHKLSSRDQLGATVLVDEQLDARTFDGGDADIGPAIPNPSRRVLIGAAHVHTFTPTTINQFRVSYLRSRSDFPNPPGAEGIPSIVTFADPLGEGFGNTSGLPQFFTDNQFQYKDDLSFIRGKHSFKAGGEYRRTRNGSSFQSGRNGLFQPYGVEDLVTDGFFGDEADRVAKTTFGGFRQASASVNPVTKGLPEFYRGYRANELAWYFQDDWRLSPRLTINAGLRWEYFGVPHNFQPGIDSNLYFGNPTPPVPVNFGTANANPFFPTNDPGAAREFGAAFQQRDHDLWRKDRNNFAPRLGVAWDVTGTQKWILRGGGGVFYDRLYNNVFENIRFNPPFFSTNTVGNVANGVPVGPLSTPGLYTAPFTSTSTFASGFSPLPNPRHMDENLETAYVEHFYLGVEHQLTPSFALEVDGLGTLGRRLTGFIDFNTYNGRLACNSTSATFPNRAACDAFGGGTKYTFSSIRVNPNLAADNFRTNGFTSNYYGLEMVLRKSISHGLQFNANYTWSHAIDELSDLFNNGRGNIARPTDNFNFAADRGNADFDIRHRFVVSYYWEVPWLKDRRWTGGWSFSGTTSVQTGVPIQTYDTSFDLNKDGYNTDRLVYTGTGDINNGVQHTVSPADGYLDTTKFVDFTCPSSINHGLWCDSPSGRNALIGPGFWDFDFTAAKRVKVTERLALQFQGSFFNLFNHTNFKNPVGNFNSGNFGKSISTYDSGFGGARVTQLALRVDF